MDKHGLSNLLFGIIILVLFGIAFFILPRFLLRRAISQVIRIFRHHHSLSKESARTIEELGFKSQSFLDRFMKPRDYKPYALQVLAREGVLCHTEDGRIYLSEEKLDVFLKQKRSLV